MNSKENIFINAIRDENCFTELFTNILQFDDFRNEFLKELKISNKIDYDYFSTQKGLGKYGQADFVISTKEIEYIIEIKVNRNTPLTENQPNGYLNYLKTVSLSKQTKLIFLLPNNYIHKNSISQNTEIQLITWEKIIQILEKLPISINENFIGENVKIHYVNFLKDWFSEIIFTKNNLEQMKSTAIPETLINLYNFIDKVRVLMNSKQQEFSISNSKFDYGITITVDKIDICLSIWFYFWKKVGFPISISFVANQINTELKRKIDNYLVSKGYTATYSEQFQNKEENGRPWYSTQISESVLLDSDKELKMLELFTDLQKLIKEN